MAAPATCPDALRARIRRCRGARCPPVSPDQRRECEMRVIGLDVHREFAEVAILEHGQVRLAGRVPTTPEMLRLFAESLSATDRVAIEATGNTYAIARL